MSAAGRTAAGYLGDDPGRHTARPPRPARVALVLGIMAGVLDAIGNWWLRPHGVGWVLIALACVILALATGAAEGAVPVPREPLPKRWPWAGLSLLCFLHGDEPHSPCAGTADDGSGRPCGCWCHSEAAP